MQKFAYVYFRLPDRKSENKPQFKPLVSGLGRYIKMFRVIFVKELSEMVRNKPE